MLTPQEILNSFYIAYWAWLQDGAKEDSNGFSRRQGLCSNLWRYGGYTTPTHQAVNLMLFQFVSATLNEDHPFNATGDAYWKETKMLMAHTNPKRIEWVRNKVSQLIF